MSHRCQSILVGKNGRALADVASVSADLADAHKIPEHSHPEDQLLFASKGVMTLVTPQGTWVVPPLRAIWIPANTPHSVEMSGQVSMRTLYFSTKLCRGLPAKCAVVHVTPLLKELILHACRHARLKKQVSEERRIIEILIDQLKTVESIPLQLPQPADARAMRVARMLFEDPSESRTLEELCEECGASKRTVQRVFLEETKMTFARWRQQLRLLHAMRLLASGEKVTAAALDAGYSSPSAFIAMFRKQLGKTPARYLQN